MYTQTIAFLFLFLLFIELFKHIWFVACQNRTIYIKKNNQSRYLNSCDLQSMLHGNVLFRSLECLLKTQLKVHFYLYLKNVLRLLKLSYTLSGKMAMP